LACIGTYVPNLNHAFCVAGNERIHVAWTVYSYQRWFM